MSAAAGIGAISISTIEGGYRGKGQESKSRKKVFWTTAMLSSALAF